MDDKLDRTIVFNNLILKNVKRCKRCKIRATSSNYIFNPNDNEKELCTECIRTLRIKENLK